MNRKTLCIIIALMVLSISALLVANPNILGGFSSTVNGVPVQVTIAQEAETDAHIQTMRLRDLQKDYNLHTGKFIRVTGIAEFALPASRTNKVQYISLEGDDLVYVHPLDAPNLPTEYHRGHKYEFTGFFTRQEEHAQFSKRGVTTLRIYAFEIRHLGEAD